MRKVQVDFGRYLAFMNDAMQTAMSSSSMYSLLKYGT